MRLNGLERGHYAEPYAGGCGLALDLLYGGHVADIHINDIDVSLWAFWDSEAPEQPRGPVVKDCGNIGHHRRVAQAARYLSEAEQRQHARPRLCNVLSQPNKQIGHYKGGGESIGGLDQSGNYKIDCRYNVDDLSGRIRRTAKYKDRIHLSNLDAIDFMRLCERDIPGHSLASILIRLTTRKGLSFIRRFIAMGDRVDLSELVVKFNHPWIVTYDDVDAIRALYRSRRQYSFDVNYSVQTKRLGTEIF